MNPLFEPLQPILEAMKAYHVRAVGGAVRAYLRHDPIAGVEVDLATNATPTQTESALRNAGIHATPEGRRWGTITAHLDGRKVDITSLREDTYTPGSRYPTVKFTADWQADALRRDFTFNAISIEPDGTLHDPFGGVADLKHGTVRFIGDPLQRLAEDPLRLMRFWRFCGTYGLGGVTPELLEVFTQAAPALGNVSRARRLKEWEKLLQTPQAQTVVTELQRTGLLSFLQP